MAQPLTFAARVALPLSMSPNVNPRYRHLCNRCTCLGQATVNGVSADLFVCDETVIARFGQGPDDYRASHISRLSALSDVFLLAAFRLYLDARGERPCYEPEAHPGRVLQS